MSPVTNNRTDEYGGTFEKRIRLLREVIRAVRNKLPDSIPLSLRISATDWMEWTNEPSWDLELSIRLAKLLPGLGVDILDVSSGGISAAQKIIIKPTYQSELAGIIRGALQNEGTQLIIATVGLIDSPEIARNVVQDAGVRQNGTISNQAVILEDTRAVQADLAFIGRAFAREPGFVLRSALELGVQVQWPFQYGKAQPKCN
jgi:2,4-dienoyl-CoA reductase-like NADH-dependent reductase (Old Yellow Enzyme family)